ncbi:hypothetical protein LSTR_LSTR013988 [Laodelphax striatellus]|uniref:SUEL-type lectin domain-containing protein n=1 Tax=Laodelphax striatellus TaxID=195883 RepID=A0A482XIE5_LAOST|nr:hypothetical protein LSTR_LSTR013988 [Laodelphax striatellus]
MSAGVSRVAGLLLLWPVSSLFCLPVHEAIFQLERTMMELQGNTVCPFTIHNVTTGGVPETVPEYRCQTNKMSDKIDNSLGRCMKGRECVQGTSTIMIEMPNGQAPVTKTLYTGCFCVSQTASSPKPVAKPGVDRT